MEILKLTSKNEAAVITAAIQVLRNGGLVVYPTETTYGIGADCENPSAIQRLIDYKSKRDGKPISVAVSDVQMAERYVKLNQTARSAYETFLPGPVTVISQGSGLTAPGVASSTGTVGIRIPDYPLILNLIQGYGKGITATSANASYQRRPYAIQDIFDNISDVQKSLIDLVIDVGELPHHEPSTVIDTTLDDIVVKRFGTTTFKTEESNKTEGPEDTIAFAQELIGKYRSKFTYAPLIFALNGEMGAGKTQFAKGLAKGLAITENVTSPTYALENEYEFVSEGRPGILVHLDTWKMTSASELDQLEIEKLMIKNGIIVIEWADRFRSEIEDLGKKATLVWIDISVLTDTDREILVKNS